MMNTSPDYELLGIVEQIREMDKVVKHLGQNNDDPANDFTIQQFEDLKKDFVKQLIAYLVQSNLDISETEPFIRKAIGFLKVVNPNGLAMPLGKKLDHNLKTTLKEMEGMMKINFMAETNPVSMREPAFA